MTQIENITFQGQDAIKITCTCSTHAVTANAAIMTGAAANALAARKGKAQSDRIHGFVTMANHPAKAIRVANERKGIFSA